MIDFSWNTLPLGCVKKAMGGQCLEKISPEQLIIVCLTGRSPQLVTCNSMFKETCFAASDGYQNENEWG